MKNDTEMITDNIPCPVLAPMTPYNAIYANTGNIRGLCMGNPQRI